MLNQHGAYLSLRMCAAFIMVALLVCGCKTIEPQVESVVSGSVNEVNPDLLVASGSLVGLKYLGRFKDGTVFSSSPEGKVLAVKVGQGKLVPGLENALIGMKVNEEKMIHVIPSDGYGARDESLVRKFPTSAVPADVTPQRGLVLGLSDESGKQFGGVITAIEGDELTVDLNHPLAGKDLYFNVKVVGIKEV